MSKQIIEKLWKWVNYYYRQLGDKPLEADIKAFRSRTCGFGITFGEVEDAARKIGIID